MQKGYLLPLSSIAAGAVDAHGGAKPELPAIRVPPSPPVDTRLGFVSIATTSNRRRQPRLDSPPPLTPGSPRKEMGLGFGRRDEWRRMDGGAGVRQRRGKNEEECERRTGEAEMRLGFGRRDEGRKMDGGAGVGSEMCRRRRRQWQVARACIREGGRMRKSAREERGQQRRTGA